MAAFRKKTTTPKVPKVPKVPKPTREPAADPVAPPQVVAQPPPPPKPVAKPAPPPPPPRVIGDECPKCRWGTEKARWRSATVEAGFECRRYPEPSWHPEGYGCGEFTKDGSKS